MALTVLFDMDGLMLDSERIARRVWKRALLEHGYVVDDTVYLLIVGRTLQDAEKVLRAELGGDFPFEAVYQKRQTYYDEELARSGVPVKAGLFELLAFLENEAIAKAVATSTHEHFAHYKLALAGIESHFQVIVCGDQVENGKPAPDLFLEAASRLGVNPADCVVLEDSEAGIRAAAAAGMIPVMIPDLKQPSSEVRSLAYRVLPGLIDMIPLLRDFQRDGMPAMQS